MAWCRFVGMTILIILFVLYAVSTVTSAVRLDEAASLAFLGVAAALIGLPAGWTIAVRRSSSER